jgi:ABC-2 type transport system ATP-binding protein
VEVRTLRATEAMRALDAMAEVEKTSLFGTAVHAVLRSGQLTPERLEDRLRAGGIPVQSVQPVAPSMEDVFLDVVERAERARAAAS